MKTLLTISLLALLSLGPARAEAEKAPVVELKTKSAFAMEASGRNPFWPIGWKPAGKDSARTTRAARKFNPRPLSSVRSPSIRAARFAIINGKTMQEGQQFGLQLGNQTYQLTVKVIEDGRVILARRDQEIIVPLRRK